MTAQAEIRALLDARSRALHDKDADAAGALYAPGALMFELAPPLSYRVDPAESKTGNQAWFDTWKGPLGYETRDFQIAVHGGDFALATGYVRIHGTKTDGTAVGNWFRQTVAFTKTTQGWRIVHQHTSAPFLMDGSYRIAGNLEP